MPKNSFWLLALCFIVLVILNNKFLYICLLMFTIVYIYSMFENKKKKQELSKQLNELTFDFNQTAKKTLINSPFPLIILNQDSKIIWKSEKYALEFQKKDISLDLERIVENIIDKSMMEKSKGNVDELLEVENKKYKVLGSYMRAVKVKTDNEYTIILYFIDQTELKNLKEKEERERINLGLISIDNYEELSQKTSGEARATLISKIEQFIYDWGKKTQSLIIKNDRDKFFVLIKNEDLKFAKKEKISLLQEIKGLDAVESIKPTLSISFSDEGETYQEIYNSTKEVQEITLGRGGDQAVIKQKGKFEFFGGRTEEVEKRTRVKARTISNSLANLIENSEDIFIMGHRNPDMDSIGSAIGIYRFAKTYEKNVKIIVNHESSAVENFVESLISEEDEEYKNIFISGEVAQSLIKKDSLLIIVDTNKKNYVEDIEILEKTSKIVVIDHHRRSTEYIENAVLIFHEVYASSASELVTELIQYSTKKIELKKIETEALYAGIMLDTKDFTFKTGVRTFEAAAFLRKTGVDIIKVKKWFRTDLETYKRITSIISRVETINGNMAISDFTEDIEDSRVVIAKAADELLTIKGIEASFVLGIFENKIYISARSVGDINVQLILEELGGGGHITLAGAQIEDVSIEEAKSRLIEAINNYLDKNKI